MSELIITPQMIWTELQKIKKTLEFIKADKLEQLIDEVSLNKARVLTGRGSKFLINEVEEHRLKAMIDVDDKGRKRYKFKYSDLMAWQANRKKETSLYHAGVQLYDSNFGKNFVKNFHKCNPKTTKQIKEASL